MRNLLIAAFIFLFFGQDITAFGIHTYHAKMLLKVDEWIHNQLESRIVYRPNEELYE